MARFVGLSGLLGYFVGVKGNILFKRRFYWSLVGVSTWRVAMTPSRAFLAMVIVVSYIEFDFASKKMLRL